jgi:hypothetical protein
LWNRARTSKVIEGNFVAAASIEEAEAAADRYVR